MYHSTLDLRVIKKREKDPEVSDELEKAAMVRLLPIQFPALPNFPPAFIVQGLRVSGPIQPPALPNFPPAFVVQGLRVAGWGFNSAAFPATLFN